MHPPVVIEGVRVRLRRSSPDDAPSVYRAANHVDVMRYLDWRAHRGVDDARAYLEGCAARWEAGNEYHWVVEHKPTRGVTGAIACRVHGHVADFGCFIGRDHWGSGFGTEAAGLLVSWLKRQPEVLRIWATTDHENARSAKVLVKLGLALEGVMRMATVRPNIGGLPRDTAVYACVKSGG